MTYETDLLKLTCDILKEERNMSSAQMLHITGLFMLSDFVLNENIRKEYASLKEIATEIASERCYGCGKCCKIDFSDEYCYFYDAEERKCRVYDYRPLYCVVWYCDKIGEEAVGEKFAARGIPYNPVVI